MKTINTENSNNFLNRDNVVSVTPMASNVIVHEVERRASLGLPGDNYKAVASEYIIAHHASLGGRGEGV
jgi:hypothetical protein